MLQVPFGFIDFRLAQCEVGDLIGMMRHEAKGEVRRMVFIDGKKVEEIVLAENVTIHDLAEWFPQDPDSYGYLFLDELFRAPRDVLNAVFELALDYKYHFKELPMGWRVIAASNKNMDVYAGTAPDPALYDRFLKIDFQPTVPEWVEHAEKSGIHSNIINYINKFPADLMTESKNIKAGETVPSPRSWFNLSDCMIYMKDQNEDPMADENYFTLLAKGYLGATVASNFVEYALRNYHIFDAKDIFNKFSKDKEMREAFEDMTPSEYSNYATQMVKYIKKLKVNKLKKTQEDNLTEWLLTVPTEIGDMFFRSFVEKPTDQACTHWYLGDDRVKNRIFGKMAKDKALAGTSKIK